MPGDSINIPIALSKLTPIVWSDKLQWLAMPDWPDSVYIIIHSQALAEEGYNFTFNRVSLCCFYKDLSKSTDKPNFGHRLSHNLSTIASI